MTITVDGWEASVADLWGRIDALDRAGGVAAMRDPGNPTRSYRSSAPLRVVAAVSDWTRLTPEDRQSWRERLGTLRQGEILG